MDWNTQREFFDKIIKFERDLLNKKGLEYCGDIDALNNFKTGAIDADVSPEKVLWIFLKKHLDAIKSYIKKGKEISDEPIIERIADARNYLFLLNCLVEEKRNDSFIASLSASSCSALIMNSPSQEISGSPAFKGAL